MAKRWRSCTGNFSINEKPTRAVLGHQPLEVPEPAVPTTKHDGFHLEGVSYATYINGDLAVTAKYDSR